MKLLQLSELEKQALATFESRKLASKEVFSVEYQGKLIGYYYPVFDQKEVEQVKKELDQVMEQVLVETGLTEEEFVTAFMKV